MSLTDDDLRELENHLLENPGDGDTIKGTGGAIKLRWIMQGKLQVYKRAVSIAFSICVKIAERIKKNTRMKLSNIYLCHITL
jgi:hypothetical protein